MGRFAVALIVVLACVATTRASGIAWNDGRYQADLDSGRVTYTSCDTDQLCIRNCSTDNPTRYYMGQYSLAFLRCTTATATDNKKAGLPYCAGNAVKVEQCCAECTNNNTCSYWQHFKPAASACSGCGICILYPPGYAPGCVTNQITLQLADGTEYQRNLANISTVGHPCGEGENDPHFRGAHGTRFEFNGLPEQSFCLLTDRNLHVNMRMRGYYDTRTTGASILKNGKAVRTWIRELGFLWTDAAGKKHSFRLLARDGKKTARGKGFLKEIEYDGHVLPLLKLGEKYSLKGGLTFAFEAYEKAGRGFFDVDAYHLKIEGLIEMGIKLRVAHPLLQTKDDAEAHLNVHFEHIYRTDDIHGIMGQTYRDGREKRALDYNTLSQVIGRPIAADGPSGAGFLDGNVKDYRTSGVLSPDCLYTAYDGHDMPTIASYKGIQMA
ncbi:hypothetical protein CLOM_g916 [Closterium sp. NIES-68]|nr:hypothetical protein CLOM_g916 [Closterium sp. NIES-68]GJP75361.1 hypothetical protein CLOP_g5817 [Closterium sp. NIES-67]